MSAFDYYQNPIIVAKIQSHLRRIKNRRDTEDCQQEIFAELYDFAPISESEALRIVERVGRKFRRRLIKDSEKAGSFINERIDDRHELGDGNYQRGSHYGSAD